MCDCSNSSYAPTSNRCQLIQLLNENLSGEDVACCDVVVGCSFVDGMLGVVLIFFRDLLLLLKSPKESNQDSIMQQTKVFPGQWHEHVNQSNALSQQIVQLTLSQYSKLPKNGKPSALKNEWTLLASICMCEQLVVPSSSSSSSSTSTSSAYRLSIVALGTGTKCVGYDMLRSDGSIVHDAHAEVVCRRSFLQFLYDQLGLAMEEYISSSGEIQDKENDGKSCSGGNNSDGSKSNDSDNGSSSERKGDDGHSLQVGSRPSSIFEWVTSHQDNNGGSSSSSNSCSSSSSSSSDTNNTCGMSKDSAHFRLRNNITFHFFVNQSPCGDASIHGSSSSSNQQQQQQQQQLQQSSAISADLNNIITENIDGRRHTGISGHQKRQRENDCVGSTANGSMPAAVVYSTDNEAHAHQTKKRKVRPSVPTLCEHVDDNNNVGRTGARPITCKHYVPGTETETEFGTVEQQQGIVRTKPGRGPRTISMSCSDKMSKWNILGIQGSLLSQFIPEPVRMATITIGNSQYFDREAMVRAFDRRMSHVHTVMAHHLQHYAKPRFLCCDLEFEDGRSNERTNACSTSMLFVPPSTVEAIIGHRGHKLGVGKKDLSKPKCFSVISKYKLLESYWRLREQMNRAVGTTATTTGQPMDRRTMSYHSLKALSTEYNERRTLFFGCPPFDHWVLTDPAQFYSFTVQ